METQIIGFPGTTSWASPVTVSSRVQGSKAPNRFTSCITFELAAQNQSTLRSQTFSSNRSDLLQLMASLEIPIWLHKIYPLVNKLVDPENHQFLMETSLPTPTTARVYVNLPEGIPNSFGIKSSQHCFPRVPFRLLRKPFRCFKRTVQVFQRLRKSMQRWVVKKCHESHGIHMDS